MKKKVKIKFVDFYKSFDPKNNQFMDILKKRYDVELSDEPEYIIYSCFGYDHLKYDCIRIFYTGECITPDFNQCDYAIGFDRLEFGDRYIRMPLYKLFQYAPNYLSLFDRKKLNYEDIRDRKFCNFVVSNCNDGSDRAVFFELLNGYRPVDSGGRYKNNLGYLVQDKLAFQKEYNFSIAFENCVYEGYATEKLMEALAARTIPIYYGDPKIGLDFNKKAFIDCADFDSFEDVVAEIKKIDEDPERLLSMLNEPAVINSDGDQQLQDFLYHIFDQTLEEAKRKPGSVTAGNCSKVLLRYYYVEKFIFGPITRILMSLKRRIKNKFSVHKLGNAK